MFIRSLTKNNTFLIYLVLIRTIHPSHHKHHSQRKYANSAKKDPRPRIELLTSVLKAAALTTQSSLLSLSQHLMNREEINTLSGQHKQILCDCFASPEFHAANSLDSFTHSSQMQVGNSPRNDRNEKYVTLAQQRVSMQPVILSGYLIKTAVVHRPPI